METLQRNPEESLRRIVFKLRFYREVAGVSQKQASEKLSVGHRSYQRIEGGETNIDITFLLRFSQLFNVNFMELVTPYPPVPEELLLYTTQEEIASFENNAIVKESRFLEWAKNFEASVADFTYCREFTHHVEPMCMWSSTKKCMNDALLARLNLKREMRKMNFYFLRPDVRLNILDNLYYHKPKYSIKKIQGLLKNGLRVEVELYSMHLYKGEEVTSFSYLKFLNNV